MTEKNKDQKTNDVKNKDQKTNDVKDVDKSKEEPKKYTAEEIREGAWRDIIDKEIATDSSLADYHDLKDVIKSHNNLQRMLGKEKIVIPDEDDKEGWEKVYNRLGRPESKKDYEFGKPEDIDENFPYDEDFESFYKKKAHKLGLNKTQARKMFKKIIKHTNERWKKGLSEFQENRKSKYDEIKKEWGNTYDSRVKRANKIAKSLDKDVQQWLQDTGLIHDPYMMKIADKLATSMEATQKPSNKEKPARKRHTPKQAESKINKLMKKEAYWNASDPGHEKIMEEIKELSKDAWPE